MEFVNVVTLALALLLLLLRARCQPLGVNVAVQVENGLLGNLQEAGGRVAGVALAPDNDEDLAVGQGCRAETRASPRANSAAPGSGGLTGGGRGYRSESASKTSWTRLSASTGRRRRWPAVAHRRRASRWARGAAAAGAAC